MDKTIYTANVTSQGGRDGHIHSSDGVLDLELAIVDGLGRVSGKQKGTNPEQLFAGGYAACFESTLGAVSEAMKIKVNNTSVNAEVNLTKDEHGFHLAVTLHISLPGMDEETGNKLIKATHGYCPYSKAIDGNVEVTSVLSV